MAKRVQQEPGYILHHRPFRARKIGAALVARNAATHIQGPLAEKDGDLSQDDHKLYADEVQTLTDKYVGEIDETAKQKEAEILQV